MKAWRAALSVTLLLILSCFILASADVSEADDTYSVELVKEDKSKLDPGTPLIKKTLIFTTYTDASGTKYYLDEETVLTEKNYYLLINAQSGAFYVTASVSSETPISGSLLGAGLEILMTESGDNFKTILDNNDKFIGMMMDGSEKAVFKPNVMYKITIVTAHSIEGKNKVEETPDFTLIFEATPIDSCVVAFKDDDEIITKLYKKGEQIGIMPTPEQRVGATFKGWVDNKGHTWKETDIVNESMILTANWERITPPDPPDPPVPPGPTPPPTPHDKETEEEEVIVEPDGTTVTIISDLIERADGTYDL